MAGQLEAPADRTAGLADERSYRDMALFGGLGFATGAVVLLALRSLIALPGQESMATLPPAVAAPPPVMAPSPAEAPPPVAASISLSRR